MVIGLSVHCCGGISLYLNINSMKNAMVRLDVVGQFYPVKSGNPAAVSQHRTQAFMRSGPIVRSNMWCS